MIGWLNSSKKLLSKYASIYGKRGLDTVAFSPDATHVLFPNKTYSVMEELLMELQKDPVKDKDIIIHGFSVGAYTYSQMLRVIEDNGDKYRCVARRIKGQVFDSPPDQSHIKTGLPQALFPTNPMMHGVLGNVIGFYQSAASNVTKEHLAASHIFHNNPVLAPSLWFYSEQDPIAPPGPCDTVINKWSNKGIDVTSFKLTKSTHVDHFRVHPELYENAVHDFLSTYSLIDNVKKRDTTPSTSNEQEDKVVGQK
jgi:hypothetical protein